MHRARRSIRPLTALLTLLASVASSAQAVPVADSGSVDVLVEEIADLKARNARLAARLDDRAGREATGLDEARRSELRAVVNDVLSDSRTRTAFEEGTHHAGHAPGRGFHIASADGSFTLRIKGEVQVRWVLNHNPNGQAYDDVRFGSDSANDTSTVVGSRTSWGFGVQRAKVKFDGSMFDKSWRYRVNGAFSRSSGRFSYEDVLLSKVFEGGVTVSAGQFKTSFLREYLVSSSRQLAVDRSQVNALFSTGRGVGLEVRYRDDTFSATGSYTNGMKTAIQRGQRFTSSANDPTEYAFAGRLEWKLAGAWNQFKGFNAAPDQETAVLLGFAGMAQRYNQNASADILLGPLVGTPTTYSGGGDLDGTTVVGLTADVSAKFGCLSLFGAVVWQQFDLAGTAPLNAFPPVAIDEGTFNPWGFVVQGGCALTEQLELFARYSYLTAEFGSFAAPPPGPFTLGRVRSSVITVGVNHFVNESVKLTADWGIDLEGPIAGVHEGSFNSIGWGFTNSSNQWVLRAQLQLLF